MVTLWRMPRCLKTKRDWLIPTLSWRVRPVAPGQFQLWLCWFHPISSSQKDNREINANGMYQFLINIYIYTYTYIYICSSTVLFHPQPPSTILLTCYIYMFFPRLDHFTLLINGPTIWDVFKNPRPIQTGPKKAWIKEKNNNESLWGFLGDDVIWLWVKIIFVGNST